MGLEQVKDEQNFYFWVNSLFKESVFVICRCLFFIYVPSFCHQKLVSFLENEI